MLRHFKPRAHAPHLLREHQLLFQSHGRAVIPLPVTELNERLAALKKRQHASRQHCRDVALAAAEVGGTSSTQSPQDRWLDFRPLRRQHHLSAWGRDYVDASLADLESEHESWLDSVVDVLQLDVDARERETSGKRHCPKSRSVTRKQNKD